MRRGLASGAAADADALPGSDVERDVVEDAGQAGAIRRCQMVEVDGPLDRPLGGHRQDCRGPGPASKETTVLTHLF